jgi:hypothetical protein
MSAKVFILFDRRCRNGLELWSISDYVDNCDLEGWRYRWIN